MDSESDVALAATFAVASEQASKLRLGKNQLITSFFEKRTILHLQHFPLIASFIGETEMNVGVLYALAPEVRRALDNVKRSVQDSKEEQ